MPQSHLEASLNDCGLAFCEYIEPSCNRRLSPISNTYARPELRVDLGSVAFSDEQSFAHSTRAPVSIARSRSHCLPTSAEKTLPRTLGVAGQLTLLGKTLRGAPKASFGRVLGPL